MDSSETQSDDLSQGTSFKNNPKIDVNPEDDAEIKANEFLTKLDIDNDKNSTIQTQDKETQATNSIETDLINLRRSLYLTLMSNLDSDGCTLKLLKHQATSNFPVEVYQ